MEPAGAAHSQFNRVARQRNERSRETLGFETRAERDLMLVLHRPIEPTTQSGHERRSEPYPQSGTFSVPGSTARAIRYWRALVNFPDMPVQNG